MFLHLPDGRPQPWLLIGSLTPRRRQRRSGCRRFSTNNRLGGTMVAAPTQAAPLQRQAGAPETPQQRTASAPTGQTGAPAARKPARRPADLADLRGR